MVEFIGIYLILVVGACLQCVIGFGFGLLCAPLVFFLAPELVPGAMILNALALTAILTFKHIRNVHLKQTVFAIIGGTIGILAARKVMMHIDQSEYQLLFGASILLAVALSLVGFAPRVGRWSNLIAGITAGFMGTTTASGGAPMGLLYQSAERSHIKANLSVFFVYINLFGFIALWTAGAVGETDLKLFLEYFPAVLCGWGISHFVNRNIQEKVIRIIILVVATFSGAFLLISSL